MRPIPYLLAASLLLCPSSARPAGRTSGLDALPLHLFAYDAASPLELESRVNQARPDMTIYDVTYASPKGGRVPAYLGVPTSPGPHAGILIQHGMPGSRDSMFRLLTTLTRTGAVTLAITAPWARAEVAGTRDGVLSFTPKDAEEQVQLIVDWRRGIDLLQSHPDVDPERLAYVGVSYGGTIGGLLAGVERRVQAYALVVGDGGLTIHMEQGNNPEFARLSPAQRDAWFAAMRPIEPIRFVPHAAPVALLFQNARRDELVPVADALAYQQAASEPKSVYWYDTGHSLNTQARFDMTEWLATWVGIDPRRLQP